MKPNETRRRTLARSATWRCVGLVVGFALARIAGAPIGGAVEITAAYNLVQLGLHFAHDRAWSRVHWGVTT